MRGKFGRQLAIQIPAAAARLALGAAVVAAGAAAGCKSDPKAVEVKVFTAAPGAPVLGAMTVGATSASPASSSAAPVARPRLLSRTIAVGGVARHYVLVVPAHVEPSRKFPLVLYFHGDGGDGEGMQRNAPFEAASKDAALVAYPDGVGRTWDLETTHDNRDVAFMEALLDDVASDFSLDRAKVFAFGYSSGGFFANVLACQRSAMLRAISSNAGGAPYHQAETWPNQFPKCPGQAPVATIALHGEQDFGVTLDSGRFTAEYWAYVNGCNMGEMETTAYPECRAYRGCNAGKDVVFCKVPGLSHWIWDKGQEVSFQFFKREGL